MEEKEQMFAGIGVEEDFDSPDLISEDLPLQVDKNSHFEQFEDREPIEFDMGQHWEEAYFMFFFAIIQMADKA